MKKRIAIFEQGTGDTMTPSCIFDTGSVLITVKELLEKNVYLNVRKYDTEDTFECRSKVHPQEMEAILNKYKKAGKKKLDWKLELEKAIKAFEKKELIIIVNKRQVNDLYEKIRLSEYTEVIFARLKKF